MEEWYHHHLRQVGHRPLRFFHRFTNRTTHERVLDVLKNRWETAYAVSIKRDETRRAHEVADALLAADTTFSEWTSYMSGPNIYFVFRDSRDAVIFKLMLPD